MVAYPAVSDGISLSRPEPRSSLSLQFLRASGLAQARLQLAVLSGNRRRALEQIERLIGIDRQLERLARGEKTLAVGALESDLADQRLAIASEKLALSSGIELPRLEPALKIPIPSARRLAGNHSDTAFAAAGQLPGSNKPEKI